MTRVRFFSRDSLLCGVEARGHSGYAEQGNDIVCAAVSAAMAVAECYLTDICRYDTEVLVDGEPRISVRLKSGSEEAKRDCDKILRAMKMSLEENAREYGSYLRVSVVSDGSGKNI